jgi:hypothetical protein
MPEEETCLADPEPIPDLMTASRKRGWVRMMGKMMGLSQGHLKKLQ